MQNSNPNNSNAIIFEEEGFPSFLHEILRIKRSKNPITVLSLYLSQYSTPTNCFYPSKEINMFDKSINIFLLQMKPNILSETIQFISFLDFQLSIGYQLKNSDYYLLYRIFSIYPDVFKSMVPIVISSQHPIEFFSIFVLNPHFDQCVFQYQLKQTYTEDSDLMNRILKYISEHKCPVHQTLYNNFSRIIPTKTLETILKNNDIIATQEPCKYNKEVKSYKSLAISNSLAFDKDDDISEDIRSVQILEKQSYIRTNQVIQLRRIRPEGNSFYVDGKAPSGKVSTRSCKIDNDNDSSFTIIPKKSLSKDIIVFTIFLIILCISAYIFWKYTSFKP